MLERLTLVPEDGLIGRGFAIVGRMLPPALLATSCVSSSIVAPPPSSLTGTYVGQQEGTHAGIAFEGEIIQFAIVQEGDSVSGTWQITNGASGTFEGAITPSDTMFEFSIEMNQALPCGGAYAGMAEVQVGVRFDGSSTIGIAGAYAGDDCGGEVQANFFVQLAQ